MEHTPQGTSSESRKSQQLPSPIPQSSENTYNCPPPLYQVLYMSGLLIGQCTSYTTPFLHTSVCPGCSSAMHLAAGALDLKNPAENHCLAPAMFHVHCLLLASATYVRGTKALAITQVCTVQGCPESRLAFISCLIPGRN